MKPIAFFLFSILIGLTFPNVAFSARTANQFEINKTTVTPIAPIDTIGSPGIFIEGDGSRLTGISGGGGTLIVFEQLSTGTTIVGDSAASITDPIWITGRVTISSSNTETVTFFKGGSTPVSNIYNVQLETLGNFSNLIYLTNSPICRIIYHIRSS